MCEIRSGSRFSWAKESMPENQTMHSRKTNMDLLRMAASKTVFLYKPLVFRVRFSAGYGLTRFSLQAVLFRVHVVHVVLFHGGLAQLPGTLARCGAWRLGHVTLERLLQELRGHCGHDLRKVLKNIERMMSKRYLYQQVTSEPGRRVRAWLVSVTERPSGRPPPSVPFTGVLHSWNWSFSHCRSTSFYYICICVGLFCINMCRERQSLVYLCLWVIAPGYLWLTSEHEHGGGQTTGASASPALP